MEIVGCCMSSIQYSIPTVGVWGGVLEIVLSPSFPTVDV